jgi:enoyl-CoA hydratase
MSHEHRLICFIEMLTPQLHVEGAIARITLRRPAQANRLGPEDLAAITEHVTVVNATPEVLVLVVAAEGRSFCSGFDISQIGRSQGAGGAVTFDRTVDAIEDCRPATIALLQGGVYGGATDLALACDFRIGVHGIDMFMPAARLGIHFYRRGLERYVSRLGLDQAKRLFLTAERIEAEEMKAIGFLTHLVAPELLTETGHRLANTLAGMAPLPLAGMKKHLNRIGRGALDPGELQRDYDACLASIDVAEGQSAWAAKRPPRFIGR